jgi:RNA polymerase sigma factor (sigma-70 family)
MLSAEAMSERERRLTEAVRRESGRLRAFIRARVANEADAEDVLQDVFSALVEADAVVEPVRQVTAWLFRVARNRIIDRFRRQRPQALRVAAGEEEAAPDVVLEAWLPSPQSGPEAAYARGILLDELTEALDELPAGQREVFVAHELEGRSFKELAAETGLNVNTLLSRKRYAVLFLRERLRDIFLEYANR